MPNSSPNEDVFDVLKHAHCAFFAAKPKLACNCQNACERDEFGYTVSTANWPRVENQLAFYEKYISPYPETYGHQFDAYANLTENFSNMSSFEVYEVLHNISGIGLIGNNFLQLKVLYEQRSVMVSQEVPTVSSDTLFSNLGGILELWMGLTVLFAAEVIVLFVKLIGVLIWGEGDAEEPTPSLHEGGMGYWNASVERKNSLDDVADLFDEPDKNAHM